MQYGPSLFFPRLSRLGRLIGAGFALTCYLQMDANAWTSVRDEGWTTTVEGQTILRPFRNAPYPHASRANGFTYQGKQFDAAGHYSDSTVGVFIPAGYRPRSTVDYVVHFHGWSNRVSNVLDRYNLRAQMAQSGLNAILLVPQGPRDATDSGGGRLELEPGAFEGLINEVTAFLNSEGKIHTNKIGRVALSTHSGGYRVTSAILAHEGLREHITDVLLFDSSYGGLESFVDWASSGHGHRLVSIFTAHLAPENFMLISLLAKRRTPAETVMEADMTESVLAARKAIFIHTVDLPHDEIMQKKGYFALFLRTSALSRAAL